MYTHPNQPLADSEDHNESQPKQAALDSGLPVQGSGNGEEAGEMESTNLRRELWQIVCNIDDLKHQMLQEFNDNQKHKPFHERTYITNGLELYKYYLSLQHPFEDSRILGKDLARTRPKCAEYKIDPSTGKNSLYNVLYAYSQFDLEIGYCQGMNYFVDLFWRNLQSEEDCFYCLVHLMKVQEWRFCFN